MKGPDGNSPERDNKGIWLITREQLAALPEGTELYSSYDGSKVVKGRDVIHDDLRGGFTAYGFRVGSKLPEGIELKEGGYWSNPTTQEDEQ